MLPPAEFLVNDSSFDISSDIEALGGKIQGLQDAGGKSLVNATEVGALTKLVSIIADVASHSCHADSSWAEAGTGGTTP